MRGAIGFYLFWVQYARLIGDRIVRYAYYLIQGGEAISLIEGSHAGEPTAEIFRTDATLDQGKCCVAR
jgi:hypothetical protein